MNPTMTSQPTRNAGPFRVLQTICISLACVCLALGSTILSVLWLGNGSVSLFDFITIKTFSSEGKFLATLVLLVLTLFVVWLLSTVALLLARQWVTASLALPVVMGIFIALFLFLAFLMPHVPSLLFVLLLLILNGGALWFARWFFTHTSA